jgi:hypothetical protein
MAEPPDSSSGKSGSPLGEVPAAGRRGAGGLSFDTGVAIATMAILTIVFVWWAWQQGAYFDTVFEPGSIIVFALLILLLFGAPIRARLSGPAIVALAALTALALWTLLSILWSSSQDGAAQDFGRVLLYATCFALGAWTCNLCGRRMLLPLAVVAALGAAIGLLIVVTLWTGSDFGAYVHYDATLRYPIGYRNADAAFLFICLWPVITLAAESETPWQLRALLIGVATMLIDLALLAQSRGSLPAAAFALLVLLVLSPRRLRIASYLGIAVLPVLPALPTLLDVFQLGHGGPGVLPLLRDAARATALSSLASVGVAAVCIRGIESRLNLGAARVRQISIAATVLAVAAVVVGGTVFFAQRGGPVKFIDQRASQFSAVGYPSFKGKEARFGTNVGSNRHDFWRVALHEATDQPVAGGGAGSFPAAYLVDRRSGESPHDPHSVWMLILSELGFVGLALLITFVVSVVIAAVRSRRLGPGAATLVAASLASFANWLFHSSYDWFWLYSGVTAPAIFLAGAAVAPGIFDPKPRRLGRAAWPAIGLLIVAIAIAIPLFLSQRYENRAYGEAAADPSAAFEDLNHAASLDPFDPEPLLAKGVLALRLHEPAQAVQPFREAIGRQPDNYASHYYLAQALSRSDPATARSEAAEALRLNPLDPLTRKLNRRLKANQSS